MTVFKCKMCASPIQTSDSSVIYCPQCGSKQTLPQLSSQEDLNLYSAADECRRNHDYDAAINIYTRIIEKNPTDKEAFWLRAISRYGISYLVSPETGRMTPSINRLQYRPFIEDTDYCMAINTNDMSRREVYLQEAKVIYAMQQNIIEIAKQEPPYDVFISYKESDANGERTQDSVMGEEIYNELTRNGYKVFFSRVTLESKLGYGYEPCIFAAINSAKVMLVIGTCPEYFTSPWVKNEWIRFIALKNTYPDDKRYLIPVYKDMKPTSLPQELAYLQSQSMDKLGAMQDLLRGVKKLTEPSQALVQPAFSMRNSVAQTLAQPVRTSAVAQKIKDKDEFQFGTYKYEPIMWQVIERNEKGTLAIAKKCVEGNKVYNDGFGDAVWENCSLRKWLNDEFISEAFSDEERALLCEEKLADSSNTEFGVSGGNKTQDKVFLLSIAEANLYFKTDEQRKAQIASGAKGMFTFEDFEGNVRYMLRSPGISPYNVAYVETDGSINTMGNSASLDGMTVRPVIRLKLD